ETGTHPHSQRHFVSTASQSDDVHENDENGGVGAALSRAEAFAVATFNGTVPEGIATVLERRLGRLSSECQNLLGKAAVLGGSFEFNQLLFMSSELHEDTLLDLLEEA